MEPDFNFDAYPVFDIAASIALLIILLVVRFLAGHAIRSRTDAAPHVQRRWTATVRNLLFFLAVIGLVLIAVAVAVVVATKELILCFSGSFMRASSRAFSVGDWIEVAGLRGEVIDHNVFVTTLHEFEPAPGSFAYTGRTAVVPNSAFFASPIRNDSLMRDYTYHSFLLTLDPVVDVFAERQAIEEIVARHHAPFREQAARANASKERRHGIDLLDPQLRVGFRTTELGKYGIGITLFCPTEAAERLENDITCDVMSFLHGIASRPDPASTDAERSGGGSQAGSTDR